MDTKYYELVHDYCLTLRYLRETDTKVWGVETLTFEEGKKIIVNSLKYALNKWENITEEEFNKSNIIRKIGDVDIERTI